MQKRLLSGAIMKNKVEEYCLKSHRKCRSQNTILFCSCRFIFFFFILFLSQLASGNQKSDGKVILPQEHVDFYTSAWGLQCPLNGLWFSAQQQSIFFPDILGNALLKTKYIVNHNRLGLDLKFCFSPAICAKQTNKNLYPLYRDQQCPPIYIPLFSKILVYN